MKTLGLIGGLGPESTHEHYRGIIALYRERKRDGHYPQFIINSIDLRKGLDFMAGNNLSAMADFLVEEIDKLARGADFGIIPANTPHIVFDEVAVASDRLHPSVKEYARENYLFRCAGDAKTFT